MTSRYLIIAALLVGSGPLARRLLASCASIWRRGPRLGGTQPKTVRGLLYLVTASLGLALGLNPAVAGGAALFHLGTALSTQGGAIAVPSAPVIVRQPTSGNIFEGYSFTLAVSAIGYPAPSYQWYKDDVAIPGATAPAYSLESPVVANTGNYYAVMRNRTGAVTSNRVNLTVLSTSTTIDPKGLIAEWRMDAAGARFGGRKAKNYADFKNNPNLFELPEDLAVAWSDLAGATITPGQPDRDGGNRGIRLQNIVGQPSQNFFIAGTARHTLSYWVKSNDGKAYDLTTYTYTAGGVGPVVRVPADGSWVQVVVSGVHGGDGLYQSRVIVAAPFGSGPAIGDITVYGLLFEETPTATPTAYNPLDGDLIIHGAGTDSVVQTLQGLDTSRAESSGDKQAYGVAKLPPRTLTTFSAYCLVKWDAARSPDTTEFLALWNSDISDPAPAQRWSLSASGAFSGRNAPGLNFAGETLSASLVNLRDGNPHVLAAVYDGARLSLFCDGILVARRAQPGLSIAWGGRMYFGYVVNGQWKGTLGYLSLYEVAHDDLMVSRQFGVYQSIALTRGQSVVRPTRFVVAEGDSITYGVGTGIISYPAVATVQLPLTSGNNFAVPGDTMAQVNARAAQVDATVTNGTRSVLALMIGSNDYAAGVSPEDHHRTVKAYLLARRAAGYRTVLCTVLPHFGDTAFGRWRTAVNTLFRADPSFYDVLCDFQGTGMDDGTDTNPGYYPDRYIDYVHPTQFGHDELAARYKVAIEAALALP